MSAISWRSRWTTRRDPAAPTAVANIFLDRAGRHPGRGAGPDHDLHRVAPAAPRRVRRAGARPDRGGGASVAEPGAGAAERRAGGDLLGRLALYRHARCAGDVS